MRLEKTIILRIPMEMFRDHLETKDNYSAWIRESIEEKLRREGDSKFIDAQIKVKQIEIKELQDHKKQGSQQLGNSEDIISEFRQDLGKPQISDDLSRNVCFKYFKEKYWSRIKNLPEYKLKNPVDVFNEILEER